MDILLAGMIPGMYLPLLSRLYSYIKWYEINLNCCTNHLRSKFCDAMNLSREKLFLFLYFYLIKKLFILVSLSVTKSIVKIEYYQNKTIQGENK